VSLDFAIDATDGNARAANLVVRGKRFDTPAFMPVATRGSVKCLDMNEIRALGYRIILMNAYHLHQRPGEDITASFGGVHGFTGYDGAILTDSGGYQLYSFGRGAKLDENGAKVFSPYDGSAEFLTPEDIVDIQLKLSSDIMMPLDVCLPNDSGFDDVADAVMLTDRWLARSIQKWRDADVADPGALFGIVQGGVHEKLRDESLDLCVRHDLPGYALGGLSVGESRDVFEGIVRKYAPRMPSDKPRYLMGVGTPRDILLSIDSGIDMFDCVLPTRNARNGMAFTSSGRLNLLNAEYKTASGPLDNHCDCHACTGYPRSYIAHLVRQKDITGLKLLTLHNLTFYKRLVDDARNAIIEGKWASHFSDKYGSLMESEREKREGGRGDD
jgi:queuine tRNA-ribosyltransferase